MVSIIVPAYNAEKYLPEAVASIISQSHTDWELLLVDDGSTDSTPALCDGYAASDPRIRALHKPNGGPAEARNFALDIATGDYIVFLDSDDLIHPEFLSLLLRTAAETQSPLVISPFRSFVSGYPFSDNANGDSLDPLVFSPSEALTKAFYQTPLPATSMILDNAPWGKLYSRRLWDDLRFPPGIWFEDMDIFYRLWLLADKIAVLPCPLIGYRQHNSSCMHTFSVRRLDSLAVADRMVEYLYKSKDDGIPPEMIRAAEVRRFAAYYNILTLIYSHRANSPEDKGTPQSGFTQADLREVEAKCLRVIKDYRRQVLADPNARRRDRLGALLSYLGPLPLRILSRLRPHS